MYHIATYFTEEQRQIVADEQENFNAGGRNQDRQCPLGRLLQLKNPEQFTSYRAPSGRIAAWLLLPDFQSTDAEFQKTIRSGIRFTYAWDDGKITDLHAALGVQKGQVRHAD